MSKQDFIEQLENTGYPVHDIGNDLLYIKNYIIRVGRMANTEINLGFKVDDSFSVKPPTGPHISPRILPINKNNIPHPVGGIHESPFGEDWEYWSRPFHEWNQTDHTVRAYLAYINHLFATL